MASGLEKLYTNSKVLTLHQIDESQRMSDAKVQKALDQVHNGIKTTQNNIYKKTEPAVEQARQDLDKLVGDEYKALGKQLSLVESTSQKDWNVFHSIKKGKPRSGTADLRCRGLEGQVCACTDQGYDQAAQGPHTQG